MEGGRGWTGKFNASFGWNVNNVPFRTDMTLTSALHIVSSRDDLRPSSSTFSRELSIELSSIAFLKDSACSSWALRWAAEIGCDLEGPAWLADGEDITCE